MTESRRISWNGDSLTSSLLARHCWRGCGIVGLGGEILQNESGFRLPRASKSPRGAVSCTYIVCAHRCRLTREIRQAKPFLARYSVRVSILRKSPELRELSAAFLFSQALPQEQFMPFEMDYSPHGLTSSSVSFPNFSTKKAENPWRSGNDNCPSLVFQREPSKLKLKP